MSSNTTVPGPSSHDAGVGPPAQPSEPVTGRGVVASATDPYPPPERWRAKLPFVAGGGAKAGAAATGGRP